jgi:hypothetical protein
MAALDKPRLRRALRVLQAIPVAAEDATVAAQEALDFLALLAGMKPVYVGGRGFGDPRWIAGVCELAVVNRLHHVEGPAWQSDEPLRGLPEWYVAEGRATLLKARVTYLCKTRATQAAVQAACSTGAPTIAEEARLLGFPECCVAAHHARLRVFHDMTLAILERRSNGDIAKMQELLNADAPLEPQTEDERAWLESATALVSAPFTSLNMCEACARSPTSPAMKLAKRYGDLAAAIDPDYFWILST